MLGAVAGSMPHSGNATPNLGGSARSAFVQDSGKPVVRALPAAVGGYICTRTTYHDDKHDMSLAADTGIMDPLWRTHVSNGGVYNHELYQCFICRVGGWAHGRRVLTP